MLILYNSHLPSTQPRRGTFPSPPIARSPAARRARVVFDDAREEVFASQARYAAAPKAYGRDTLRECVAGALELCATETALPLGTVLTMLTVDAELTPSDLTGEHDGRTPWRRRVLREAEQLRASTFWRRLRTGERA